MNDTASSTIEILVVGAGMAAHRLVTRLLHDPGAAVRVTVIGDESHGPYDRSALVGLLSGTEPAELQLDRSVFRDERVRLIRDDRVLRIDPSSRTVRTRSRRTYHYDTLVLATGSFAARVAVDGARLPGCFVLHTIDDAESMRDFVRARSRLLGRPLRGTVIGGGLPGVETASALHGLGIDTTIVQYPDRLMPAHLDRTGAAVLQRALEEQGIAVRTRTRTTRLDPDDSGAVTALEFQDGTFDRTDVVVFTVGVRPRDELARNAGLDVHPHGGVIIDDRCGTSDPNILAIGEVCRFADRHRDAAGPARETADIAVARILGKGVCSDGREASVDRTVAGIALACFGDPLARADDAVEVVTRSDAAEGVYRKLVLTDDARTLVGGVLVGDTSDFGALRRLVGVDWSSELAARLQPEGSHPEADAVVCAHLGLTQHELRAAIPADGVSTFSTIRARFGGERGCERCTGAVARVLTELAEERAPHDSRVGKAGEGEGTHRSRPDGRQVMVPEVMDGGELTPAHLMAIGRIAEAFHLQPRIDDGRIELRGVRPAQLSSVQDQLIAAGLRVGAPVPGEDPQVPPPIDRRAIPGRATEQISPHATEQRESGSVVLGWRGQERTPNPPRRRPIRAENPG